MHKELLAQSPLLALPLAALVIFLGVFVYVVLRAMTRAKGEIAEAAYLPLNEREESRHE
jgi:cbb3-type cytochrome oxidase subunit 3